MYYLINLFKIWSDFITATLLVTEIERKRLSLIHNQSWEKKSLFSTDLFIFKDLFIFEVKINKV